MTGRTKLPFFRGADMLLELGDERQDHKGKRQVLDGVSHDVSLGFSFNTSTSFSRITDVINDVREPVFAVALHGMLPPGTVALVVPFEYRQDLVTYASQDHWLGSPQADSGVTAPIRMPEYMVALWPGDVHSFDRIMSKGVSVRVASPGTSIRTNPNFGPNPAALLRVYRHAEYIPSNLGYRRIPGHIIHDEIATASPPTNELYPFDEANDFATMVLGATHIKLTFQDNVATQTPIVGAETGSWEVWWLDGSGIWLHHHDDDFDAAGRGVADGNHFVEEYEVNGMIAMYVTRASGSSFYYHVTTHDRAGVPR